MRKALLTAAAALLLSVTSASSEAFSAWFSGHISLPLASVTARASALVDWPVGEALLVYGAPVLIVLFLLSAVLRKPPKAAALALSIVFLAYAVLWVPLCFVPARESEPYEAWRLMKLSRTLGAQAETLRQGALDAEETTPQEVLSMARDAVASLKLSDKPLYTPKFSRYPQIFKALKIAGLYAPWTGETIVCPYEPLFTLPFLATHELAHASGVAREDEANYIAYRACMTGDARFQYAGTIYALRYAMDALRGIDLDKWLEIRMEFSDGVREDFWRIDDLGEPTTGLAAFSDRAAEAFLRMSGQPAGLSSYTGMVNFLLSDVSLVDDSQTLQREDAVQYID